MPTAHTIFVTFIQPRRTTTRLTRSAKDTENINARPSRLTTRVKPALTAGGTSAAVAATTINTRATASTATSKAKSVTSTTTAEAAGAKRKREVLVEVTGLVTNHKGKSTGGAGGLKGKEKEKETARNTTATTKVVKTAVKPPVKSGGERNVAGITQRRGLRSTSESTTTSNSKTDTDGTALQQDEKMEVDDPLDIPPPLPVASSVTSKRLPTVVAEEEDLGRVFKRRHTEKQELEALDESQVEADNVAAELVEEIVPSDQLWDDLDAEDWDDPVMVSEYVVDVSVYLKQIEVGSPFFKFTCGKSILTCLAADDASKPKLYGQARRNHLGTPWYSDRLAASSSREIQSHVRIAFPDRQRLRPFLRASHHCHYQTPTRGSGSLSSRDQVRRDVCTFCQRNCLPCR